MIVEALKELGITNDFAVDADVETEEHYKRSFKDISGENRFIEWPEVKSKMDELQADYDAKQYQRDRKYPDLGEQFDLLFKDINEGTLDKTGGFYTAIKAVKDTHPKPGE